MKKITLMLICAVALWPALAYSKDGQTEGAAWKAAPRQTVNRPAEQPNGPGKMANREMFRKDGKAWDRMASVRFYKLIEYLDLTTEEANKLAPAVQALDNSRKDYFQARDKALDNLAGLVKKGATGNEMKKAVTDIKTLDDNHQVKEQGLTRKVLELLPPEKQAKYYLFSRHFTQEVRQGFYRMAEQRMKGNEDPRLRERMQERMKERVKPDNQPPR